MNTDLDEALGLERELLFDVVGAENGFESHPLHLHAEPVVDDLLEVCQRL